MRDPLVDQTAQAFQELHPRIAEVIASGFAPQAPHGRDRRGAEETSGTVGVRYGFFFHFNSPSFRRSEPYSPTLHARAKGRPWTLAVPRAASACRSEPPAHRLS